MANFVTGTAAELLDGRQPREEVGYHSTGVGGGEALDVCAVSTYQFDPDDVVFDANPGQLQ